MTVKIHDLSRLLAPYKKGWVALNKEETKVLAHAQTFAAINEKIKDHSLTEIVLFPLGHTRSYFIGFLNG